MELAWTGVTGGRSGRGVRFVAGTWNLESEIGEAGENGRNARKRGFDKRSLEVVV